jgi:hypothetical protein
VKARPSSEKRRKEMERREHQKDKAERRKIRKEGGGLDEIDAVSDTPSPVQTEDGLPK